MNRSPLRAIRRHCYGCSGEVWKEVNECVIPECDLYPFRFGVGIETAMKRGKDIAQPKAKEKK